MFVLTKMSVVILANICVPTVFLVCNSRCKIHHSIDIYNLHYTPPPFTNHQVIVSFVSIICFRDQTQAKRSLPGGGAVGGGGGAYGGWTLLCGPF